jgi:hypothetical protein
MVDNEKVLSAGTSIDQNHCYDPAPCTAWQIPGFDFSPNMESK